LRNIVKKLKSKQAESRTEGMEDTDGLNGICTVGRSFH
jgi:hypothetical protein